jgi:hypothetical protein
MPRPHEKQTRIERPPLTPEHRMTLLGILSAQTYAAMNVLNPVDQFWDELTDAERQSALEMLDRQVARKRRKGGAR